MTRRCKSALGLYLAPKIKKFLVDNAKLIESDENITIEVGMEDIANAVEYGWSVAMSSSIVQSSFALGIAPPPIAPSTVTAGGPVGTLIYSSLKPKCTE